MPKKIANPEIEEQSLIDEPGQKHTRYLRKALILLIVFMIGLSSGLFIGLKSGKSAYLLAEAKRKVDATVTVSQINPREGYTIPAVLGDVSSKLLAAGAIDLAQFTDVYAKAGIPLSEKEQKIFTEKSDAGIVITQQNQYFLLNLLWALGLTNQNSVLTDGPMMDNGKEQAGNFASTGGWTIGTKPPSELYASPILTLTAEQQARVDEAATLIYRPCCDNATFFPDCNHGMAMLGLLELMASQNATSGQMLDAAKYVNAFWFPQQSLAIATYFKAQQKIEFAKIDAQTLVSASFSSGSGFQQVQKWLVDNNLVEHNAGNGGSCGV
jgi:hypothetical protein